MITVIFPYVHKYTLPNYSGSLESWVTILMLAEILPVALAATLNVDPCKVGSTQNNDFSKEP